MRYLNLASTTFDFDYKECSIFVNLNNQHLLHLSYNELDEIEQKLPITFEIYLHLVFNQGVSGIEAMKVIIKDLIK